MRGDADLAICIDITIGAQAIRDTAAIQQRTGVWHGRVDGVGAEEVVIGTEDLEAAGLTVDTDVLPLGSEDKEDVIYGRRPALDLLGMRNFFLNIRVKQSGGWISRSIYP